MWGRDEHIVEVEEPVVRSIERHLLMLIDEPKQEGTPHTICKVARAPWEEEHDSYCIPKAISIGPFHRGNPALQPMEKMKHKYLQDLIKRDSTNTLQKYVKVAIDLEQKARKQYSEEFELGSDDFVEMLVLDGCYIIENFLKGYLNGIHADPMIHNDLLLLENQIPFFVVNSLFQVTVIPEFLIKGNVNPRSKVIRELTEGDDTPVSFMKLAHLFFFGSPFEGKSTVQPPHHLLSLFHSAIKPTFDPKKSKSVSSGHDQPSSSPPVAFVWFFGIIFFLFMIPFLPFFIFVGLSLGVGSYILGRFTPAFSLDFQVAKFAQPIRIPSATYLRDSGFIFKKTHMFEPSTFLKVTFQGRTIKIPQFSLAWEQCCPESGDYVTTYARFMSSLIKTTDDVTILSDSGIMGTSLASKEEVLYFFTNICKGEQLDKEGHYLSVVVKHLDVERIDTSTSARIYKLTKKLIPDYATNPWAIPSMIGAFILLSLTVLQTTYTVLAYYHQPSHS